MKKILIVIASVVFIYLIVIVCMANNRGQLEYPLDETSKQILREELRDRILPDLMFDAFWKKLFHFMTFFESLDGFDTTTSGGGGSRTLNGNLLYLATAATSASRIDVSKHPTIQGLVTFSQISNFRSYFLVGSIAAQEIYIQVGSYGGQGYGFKVVNGSLYGFTNDGTTESTKLLQTISASTNYAIEARYYPTKKVVFLVDTVEKGLLATNLPSPTAVANVNLSDISIKTTENVAKTLELSFFEYLQFRNILK